MKSFPVKTECDNRQTRKKFNRTNKPMTAAEKLILNLNPLKAARPVVSETVAEKMSKAQIKEFIIDLYFELSILQTILHDHGLDATIGKDNELTKENELTKDKADGSTLTLLVNDGRSLFSFNLTADYHRQLFKVYFDYQFERNEQIIKIQYHDTEISLADYRLIDSEWLIERFNHLYFSRNELATFKRQF